MTSRVGFLLAVLILLVAAFLRLGQFAALPPGLNSAEITDIRVAETAREGRIEVFYDLGGQGREGLYHVTLAASSIILGNSPLGFRIVSVWVGLITLALLFALVTRLYGPLAGVSAMALLAVSLWPVLLSRQVGRETFLPLIVTAVMLATAQAFSVYGRGGSRRAVGTAPFVAFGFLVGLSFYVHPAGFLITLASMLFIVFMILTRQALSRRTRGYTSFALLVLIIVATPYLVSSIRLPELGGARRIISETALGSSFSSDDILANLGGLVFSGDGDPARNIPRRLLFDPLSSLIWLIGLAVALRYRRNPRFALPLTMSIALLPAMLFTADGPDFRTYAALLPLLALFFGVGVSAIYWRMRHEARAFAIAGLSVLFVFNLGWTGLDLFDRWPGRDDVGVAYHARIAQLARHIDHTAADLPTVVCTPDLYSTPQGLQLTTAQMLTLMQQRKNLPVRYVDCGTSLILPVGGGPHQILLTEAAGIENVHPRLQQDWLALGSFEVGDGLPDNAVIHMDVMQEVADIAGNSPPGGFAPEAPGESELAFFPVRFGGNITLLGYDEGDTTIYKPGDIVTSLTYWRVEGDVPPDLRLFTHVLSDPAAITAQNDTISILPGQLQPADIFIQVTFVALPASIPPGEYDISIGAYQDSDNQRLEVFDGAAARGTRLFLYPINIDEAPTG